MQIESQDKQSEKKNEKQKKRGVPRQPGGFAPGCKNEVF